MSSTVSKASPASAPRDKEGLVRLGRFQLRALANELGLLTSEESKNAFMAMSVDEQAGAVLDALKLQDKGGGGSAPAAAAPAEKPKRTPVSASAMKESAPAASDSGAGNGVVLEGIKNVLEDVKLLHDKIDVLNERAEKAEAVAAVAINLSLMLAEQVLGGGRPEVLGMAIEDLADTVKALSSVGKAKKGKLRSKSGQEPDGRHLKSSSKKTTSRRRRESESSPAFFLAPCLFSMVLPGLHLLDRHGAVQAPPTSHHPVLPVLQMLDATVPTAGETGHQRRTL